MNGRLVLQLLFLLAVANSAPIFAKWLSRGRSARAFDAGFRFYDGRPVFGPAKTIRGIVASLAATTVAAYLIGQSVLVGSIVAAAAMAGDLASSFVKRRFGLPSSSQVIGLDQIPEALLPLIAVCLLLSLSLTDMAVTLLAFFVGDLLLSRIFFRLGVRDRPY